jgi:iron complex outermembrane recepter protein
MNVHRMSCIAAAIAALAPALPAFAADEAPEAPAQRVIVTGSNIKRIDVETSDPVAIIRRADIERTGASTLAELLQSLPWSTSSLNDLDGAASFASGASSAALRHLDKQSTLVLLNGRRVAPFAMADFQQYFTNIDTLPLDAIDRIELLKNGASAIYGSDAVAGVVNIITRNDYQGLEVGVDVERSLTSDSFGERGIHGAGGFGDLKADGFNVTASAQYYQRDGVVWRDVVDAASAKWSKTLPQGQDQLSPFSSPGNIASENHDWHAVAGCDPAMVYDGLCYYDRYKELEAVPAAERTSLLVSGTAMLDPDTEAFAELLWAQTKTTYRYAKPSYYSGDSAFNWTRADNGEIQSFNNFWLHPDHPLNDTGEYAALTYRFTDADSGEQSKSQTHRLVTGLRGVALGYDWETSVAFLGSTTHQRIRGIYSRSGFSKLIGGTTDLSDANSPIDPNFFNIPGGYRMGQQNSRAVLDALFPELGYNGKLTQTALDGKISGELTDLPAGPVSFATGYDLRHERSVITPSANIPSGDIVGSATAQTDAARTYGAVFGELIVPVTDTLETQLAARVDKFPGFDAHVSPKIGLRFQPTKDLLLRATAEGGFRAPNLAEAGEAAKTSFQQMSDPQRCVGAQSYADDLRAEADALPDGDPRKSGLQVQADQALRNECTAPAALLVKSNPALKPEVSHGLSFGLVFEPLQNTNFSLDYWQLERHSEIVVRDSAELLADEDDLPPGAAVQRGPLSTDRTFTSPELQQRYGITAGPLTGVTTMFHNVASTRTDGVDFGARTRFGTPAGVLDLNLLGTWLNRFQTRTASSGGYGENWAGAYGFARLNGNLTAALTTGPFLNGVKLNYSSGTSMWDTSEQWSQGACAERLQVNASDCRVKASLRTDYFFTYSGIRDVTISAYVSNLFDEPVPFDYSAVDVVPPVGDVSRRSLRLALNYKFL